RQGDLAILDLLAAARAGLAHKDRLAEPALGGAYGNVDVVVEILGGDVAAAAGSGHALRGDADHRVAKFVHQDAGFEGISEGKYPGGHAGAQHAHVAHLPAVLLHQEPAGRFLNLVDLLVLGGGGHDPRVVHEMVVVNRLGEDAHGHHADHSRNGLEQ